MHTLDASSAEAPWNKRIERIVGHKPMGVAVGAGRRLAYSHGGRRPRTPASNEKLLLSMALLDHLGPHHRIPTTAAARAVDHGVIRGDLWVLGRGDPTLTQDAPSYWGDLRATTLADLARRIKRAGVNEIRGRVLGARRYFAHDFDAPGWQPYVPDEYVQLATSLALNGNYAGASSPERRVAAALTRELERNGVSVHGDPGAGRSPSRLREVAAVRSPPLGEVVGFMNRDSDNFFAEMLGKLLGAEVFGPPGTIRKGARAIEAWARSHGVRAVAHDSSGLSYRNRVSPQAIVRLLGLATTKSWGGALRDGLAAPGEGTLGYRLTGLRVRAKTGTLFNGASALSGWVRSDRSGRWLSFSILDRDVPKTIEDRIVHTIAGARVSLPRPVTTRVCAAPR